MEDLHSGKDHSEPGYEHLLSKCRPLIKKQKKSRKLRAIMPSKKFEDPELKRKLMYLGISRSVIDKLLQQGCTTETLGVYLENYPYLKYAIDEAWSKRLRQFARCIKPYESVNSSSDTDLQKWRCEPVLNQNLPNRPNIVAIASNNDKKVNSRISSIEQVMENLKTLSSHVLSHYNDRKLLIKLKNIGMNPEVLKSLFEATQHEYVSEYSLYNCQFIKDRTMEYFFDEKLKSVNEDQMRVSPVPVISSYQSKNAILSWMNGFKTTENEKFKKISNTPSNMTSLTKAPMISDLTNFTKQKYGDKEYQVTATIQNVRRRRDVNLKQNINLPPISKSNQNVRYFKKYRPLPPIPRQPEIKTESKTSKELALTNYVAIAKEVVENTIADAGTIVKRLDMSTETLKLMLKEISSGNIEGFLRYGSPQERVIKIENDFYDNIKGFKSISSIESCDHVSQNSYTGVASSQYLIKPLPSLGSISNQRKRSSLTSGIATLSSNYPSSQAMMGNEFRYQAFRISENSAFAKFRKPNAKVNKQQKQLNENIKRRLSAAIKKHPSAAYFEPIPTYNEKKELDNQVGITKEKFRGISNLTSEDIMGRNLKYSAPSFDTLPKRSAIFETMIQDIKREVSKPHENSKENKSEVASHSPLNNKDSVNSSDAESTIVTKPLDGVTANQKQKVELVAGTDYEIKDFVKLVSKEVVSAIFDTKKETRKHESPLRQMS